MYEVTCKCGGRMSYVRANGADEYRCPKCGSVLVSIDGRTTWYFFDSRCGQWSSVRLEVRLVAVVQDRDK